jgi:hypothetical protein
LMSFHETHQQPYCTPSRMRTWRGLRRLLSFFQTAILKIWQALNTHIVMWEATFLHPAWSWTLSTVGASNLNSLYTPPSHQWRAVAWANEMAVQSRPTYCRSFRVEGSNSFSERTPWDSSYLPRTQHHPNSHGLFSK